MREKYNEAVKTTNERIESLEAEKDQLLTDINSIKTQLYDAKSLAMETGQYSDSQWYRDATFALKKKQQRLQSINLKIGKLNRNIKHLRNIAFERIFIEEARNTLEPRLFQAIVDEANRRFELEVEAVA